MLPAAYVIHQIRGRTRLRIKEKRNDAAYFEQLRAMLNALDCVDEVRCNPATATVLVLHPGQSCEELVEAVQQLGSLALVEGAEPVTSPLGSLSSRISMIDEAIAGGSGGIVDLRTLAYVGLLGLTIRQAMRGQVLGPALPMMWQAISLINRLNGGKKERGMSDAVHQGEGAVADGDA